MKKKYMKPQIEVVRLQHSHLLAGSAGANSLTSPDGLIWVPGGIDDNDDDN